MPTIQKERKLNKKLAVAAATALTVSAANANNVDGAFADLNDVFISWFQGSLGKILALLGFAGTFIVYMMTHRGSVLFIGLIISLLAGALVDIVDYFFGVGLEAFK